MPRERKGLVRKSGGQSKDPYVIFVVAAEGEVTEVLYFQQIKALLENVKTGRLIKIEPLERQKGISGDARDVIKTLDIYRQKYILNEGDELWCLIDRDNLKVWNIAEADKLCREKGYEFCMTTPCFELWLLLHLRDLTEFSFEERSALLANRRDNPGNRTYSEHELNLNVKIAGGTSYRKDYVSPIFMLQISAAVRRAFEMHLEENHWHTDQFCTRLHLLLQRIFKLEPPHFTLPEK
jgi:hypothetical protein